VDKFKSVEFSGDASPLLVGVALFREPIFAGVATPASIFDLVLDLNTQTESKPRRLLAEMVLSEVRKNPQEPAQTRGSRQKKANPEGLVFPLLVGWGQLKDALKPA
jgi:hypothetical protein